MNKFFGIIRRLLRWLPLGLLLIGLLVELGIIVAAFKFDMDFLYIAILLGFLMFTPPPFLSLVGAFVEDSRKFRIMHLVILAVGGLLMVLSWLATAALVKKTAFELIQRKMHGY
jgi:hypothetical protein